MTVDTKALGGAMVAALLAILLAVPSGAAAQGEQGPTPQPGYEEFHNCPIVPPGSAINLCIRIEATGQLDLGEVQAEIDEPMEIMVGVGAGLGDDPPVVVVAEDEGESEPVMVPGGLLGIEALDPLIEPLDVLKLLTIGAYPQLGDPDAQITDLVIGALFSANPDEPVDLSELGLEPSSLGLPLSIQLENTLFGDRCYIGTPDDPIQIGLTTGETSPPEGTDPIEGGYGFVELEHWDDGQQGIYRVTGNQFVDNAFAVPGARNCNTLTSLGLGDTPVESLVNTDSLINSQTGLPSEAGQNEASFEFDFHIALQEMVFPPGNPTPSPLDFGEVPVGESAVETITYTNDRQSPLEFGSGFTFPTNGPFEAVADGCENQTLEPGEQCEVDMQFTPDAPGETDGSYQVSGPPAQVTLIGEGV